jgi:pyridoxine 5-phosphate synthase
MTRLSVNLNKIALLRNSRRIGIPSVTRAARIVIDAGAHGITVHPRPDERHIHRTDVRELALLLRDHPGIEYNIEGNPFPEFMDLVHAVRPDQCTLVPDSPAQATSDHGWDLETDGERIAPLIRRLKEWGCRVSLFMDAEPDRIARAAELGADRVELYTEPYAAAFGTQRGALVLDRFAATARKALEAGLELNAGHDLNLRNLGPFLAIPGVLEVSIGHALIADALEMGLFTAVEAYLRVIREASL